MKRFFKYCILLFAMCSCQSTAQSCLNQAEELLHSNPDSALILLKSVKPELLNTRYNKAKYSLLLSAALDKNYIDISSDSLIKNAVDYYDKHGNVNYKMLAWYYYGIVLINGKRFPMSMIALEKAEKEALSLNDYYYLGLINRNKALVFSETLNGKEAIRHHLKAISYFDSAQAPSYKSYSELALAIDYLNNKNYSKADSVLQRIANLETDPNLLYNCLLRKASILVINDSIPKKAISYYQQVPETYYSSLDYARRALAHELIMERDSADYWLSKGYATCYSHEETAALDNNKARMALRRGHYKDAYYLTENAMHVEDSIFRVLLYQSVSGAQRDFFKSEAARQEQQLRNTRQERLFGWILSLLIVIIGSICFFSFSREKDRQLQEQISRLALRDAEIIQTLKTNAHLLGNLFSSRIGHLDQLVRSYFNSDEEQEKEVIFKQIKQSVSTLRNNPEAFKSLENDLNLFCNEIISKLRTQVPAIKGNNLRIITLFFAGFPYEIVQIIMNSPSIDSLKMDRTRYRKAIIAAHAKDESLFLEMLDIKKHL